MKAYITKYALTTGVLEVEGEVCDNGMLAVRSGNFGTWVTYYPTRDWCRTEADALDCVRDMLSHALASHAKKLAKLRGVEALVLAGKLPLNEKDAP